MPHEVHRCYKIRESHQQQRPTQAETNQDEHYQKPKLLRSSTSKIEIGGVRDIFADECIFCRCDKFTTDSFSRKRLKEKLVLCQSIESSTAIIEAANAKCDESLLVRIRTVDLIAKEAKYHSSCYKSYTRKKNDRSTNQTQMNVFDEHFEMFFQTVIEEKVINHSEILRMSHINRIFNNFIQDKEGDVMCDFTYRNWLLKRRIQKRCPAITFFKLKQTESEILFHSEQTTHPSLYLNTGDDLDSDDDMLDSGDDSDIKLVGDGGQTDKSTDDLRTLFLAAKLVKSKLAGAPPLDASWPPFGSDLGLDAVEKMIPVHLFNFIAWIFGFDEDIQLDRFVTTPPDTRKLIFSLSQDIIYAASAGRKQTPKHLSLGMAIRHITGSSKLISLLNGLGHSVSHSVVLEHDTALAEKIMSRHEPVPPGFQKQCFTTLVWDNNDFGEETLTGAGTTHGTNAIIVQDISDNAILDGSQSFVSPPNNSRKTHRRSITLPNQNISTFVLGKKVSPDDEFSDITSGVKNHAVSRLIDLSFVLSRLTVSDDGRLLSAWTGFNTELVQQHSPTNTPVNKIGYLPMIDASPTDMSTVNAVLRRSLQIADWLDLERVVLVFDQAIYAKAQQIRWKNSVMLERLIVRLGDFHTSMAFLSAIGERVQDSGLKDVIIEANLVAAGSADNVLTGKHYNRATRVHKIMFESLHRLCLKAFIEIHPTASSELSNISKKLISNFDAGCFEEILSGDNDFRTFVQNYDKFIAERSKANPTFSFWMSYLEMVGDLLAFIRATREGNWDLHLETIQHMLPWVSAYKRVHYARYLPVYLLEMRSLVDKYPDVHDALSCGKFAIRRQSEYGFSLTACDQVIEQTANRDSKTKGGIVGFSNNRNAVHRWIVSHHARADISKECEHLASREGKQRKRKDLDKTKTEKHEQSVVNVVNTISAFSNPFMCDDDKLLNIASGMTATTRIKEDIGRAYSEGQLLYNEYIDGRLLKKNDAHSVFDAITFTKLSTFADTKKRVSMKSSDSISMKVSTSLLGRIALMGQSKTLDMRELLVFNLTPFPYVIAHCDGTMSKTNKATLAHHLDSYTEEPSQNNLSNPSLIVDAMAMIQKIKFVPPTFGELSKQILSSLISLATQYKSRRIDFVADTYPPNSIKDAERNRRCARDGGATVFTIMSEGQKTPEQFSKFLKSGTNKESLVQSLFVQWSMLAPNVFKDVTVFLTHGRECHSFSAQENVLFVELVSDLTACDHEEADTRLLLHASHATRNGGCALILSDDTDVYIIALGLCHYFHNDSSLYMLSGKQIRNVTALGNILGEKKCSMLLGYHPFSGCDTVSCFRGKGKVKPLQIAWDTPQYMHALEHVGKEWQLDSTLTPVLEKFVCHIYGHETMSDVNELRYKLFSKKPNLDTLPPNKVSQEQHVLRANYQSCIYRRAMDTLINAPTPETNGWLHSEDRLVIKWGTLPIAPDYLTDQVRCNCKKSQCSSKKCRCKAKNIPCTEKCTCADCDNHPDELPSCEVNLFESSDDSENSDLE